MLVLQGNITLRDIQEEIFKVIPILLEDVSHEDDKEKDAKSKVILVKHILFFDHCYVQGVT